MDEVEPTPQVSRWMLLVWNWQSRMWGVEHWVLTHLFPLNFCPSCSGYFQEACMTLPDKCEACYARDYGIPVYSDPSANLVQHEYPSRSEVSEG
jgi:hypothetical protein